MFRTTRTAVTILGASSLATTCAFSATAEEGLFRPGQLDTPPAVSEAVRSVVRVRNRIAFDVHVFPDRNGIEAHKRAHPGAAQKKFTPNGVFWRVNITFDSIKDLCGGPAAEQPGNLEICASFERHECPGKQCSFVTDRLGGSATGFIVGRTTNGNLLVMTAYHVAREAIERENRTAGAYVPAPVQVPDMEVELSDEPGRVYAVELVANASAADWGTGKDWAIIEVMGTARAPLAALPIADSRPTVGSRLWIIGFPSRTVRTLPPQSSYQNASGDLRVSTGTVVGQPALSAASADIYADADGVAGNSGSPAVNEHGEVVGLFRAHTYYVEGADQRLAKFGGLAQLVPGPVLAYALLYGPGPNG